MVTSTGGSSIRRRTCRTTQPTASPTATPPTTTRTKRMPASQSENVPLTAATTATRSPTSAVASLTRLSPSTMTTIRRGTPSRLEIAVAAIGSVGETTAPSTKAAAQLIPIAQCATTATTTIVIRTSPIASRPIGPGVRAEVAERGEERRRSRGAVAGRRSGRARATARSGGCRGRSRARARRGRAGSDTGSAAEARAPAAPSSRRGARAARVRSRGVSAFICSDMIAIRRRRPEAHVRCDHVARLNR